MDFQFKQKVILVLCISLLLVSIVTAQTTVSISVTGVIKEKTKPVAAFIGSPVTGTDPLFVTFTDKSTGSPTTWKWEYKTGKDNWKKFSTSQNPTYTFSKGTHDIRLTVTNKAGSDTITKNGYIVVSEKMKKPVARFSVDPNMGRSPLKVTFKDYSLYNPTKYAWNFDDGVTSTVKNPVHTYDRPGVYHVRLTVSNSAGSDSTNEYVVVLPQRWFNWWGWR